MIRFLAGVVSALLLLAAGFFIWKGLASDGVARLPAPPGMPSHSASGAGMAAPPEASEATREEKRFVRYDRDRDGAVDRDEYLATRHKAFARLDNDGDGKLSFDEYAVKTEAKFAAADADKSGRLDAAEFAATRVVRRPQAPCVTKPAAASPAEDEG